MAAELFNESQQIVQAIIVIFSIAGHLIVRPYEDRAGNIVVVLFGICELFGILGAQENEALQWIHVLLLMLALVLLCFFGVKSTISEVKHQKEQ